MLEQTQKFVEVLENFRAESKINFLLNDQKLFWMISMGYLDNT